MSNATGSSRRTTAYPTIVPYPQRRSQSAHDRSFYWFRHACCIPTTSVLWMIVVLFLFAVILLAICCFSLFLTRWIYLRQIRKKAEVIRQKYKKEDDIRRESDLRLREIALKPIHTIKMEPKRDQPYFEGYDRQRPFEGYDYQRKPPEPVQGYINRPDDVEKRYPPLAPTPMADRTGLDGQNMLFTGGTPLRSASLQPQEPPGPSKPGSGEVGTDRTQPEGVGAPEAKRVEAAPETKPAEPKPEEIAQQTVDETKMKPDDVAATAHTIAKYQKGDICPQTPGSVAAKKTPAKDIVSDVLEPTTVDNTSAKKSDDKIRSPELTREKRRAGGSDSSTATPSRPTDMDQGGYKPAEDTLPTRPYFPYWTARRYVTSSVDTTVSPSGKRIGSKSVTTERSFWQPSGTDRTGTRSSKGLQAPMPTGSTPPPDRRLADLDRQTADPRQPAQNVYDLRRQLERMRANEISSGMQDLLNDSRQNHDRKTALPLMFRSDTLSTPTQHRTQTPPTTNPVAFPSLKASIDENKRVRAGEDEPEKPKGYSPVLV